MHTRSSLPEKKDLFTYSGSRQKLHPHWFISPLFLVRSFIIGSYGAFNLFDFYRVISIGVCYVEVVFYSVQSTLPAGE
jgi:hypothetical protein